MLSDEKKLYLEGFIRGVAARQGSAPPNVAAALGGLSGPGAAPGGDALHPLHRAAQDRFIVAGQKLAPEEDAKRRKNPFDMWDEMLGNAAADKFPKGTDVFLHKFHGLFYVAPAQDGFMCRLRMPNGILSSQQLRGLADLADEFGGGYTDITTRANLQIREIAARNGPPLLIGVQELGLTSRGAGADNIRNVTGTPTAGIDPQELIDTRPLCRELHHYILNHRELYGLPRKFNIAFDGGGQVAVLEDTNDIGFAAVAVGDGQAVPAGLYFRMALGGITGHSSFAADTGVILRPEDCVPIAAAVLRVFIDHGDRTDRKTARMKYVIDKMGLDAYMAEVETHLKRKLQHLPLGACRPRAPRLKDGHIGVHRQRQPGRFYVGVTPPAGRVTTAQMRTIADIAERFGSGTIRLTVWQNLLISDVADGNVEAVTRALDAAGLAWSPTSLRGSLVACTGNTGCKFSASDTKGHAAAIGAHLEGRVTLDQPINIHLTGCPHSCAQHFIADIGLLATKIGDDGIEGYHVSVGGGAHEEQALARELYRDVAAADAPAVLERILRGYLAHRRSAESFQQFTIRHETAALKQIFDSMPAQVAAA
ncbi:MAG TPA: NirA family protein [Alphaproteobacteria bacterium]